MSNPTDPTYPSEPVQIKQNIPEALYKDRICPLLSMATLMTPESAVLVSGGSPASKPKALATCVGPRCQFFGVTPAPDRSFTVAGCAINRIAEALSFLNMTAAAPLIEGSPTVDEPLQGKN